MKNTESKIRQISEVNKNDIQNKLGIPDGNSIIAKLVTDHNIMVQYIYSDKFGLRIQLALFANLTCPIFLR